MNCPKCNAESSVIETRNVRRRRECVSCKHRFSTLEVLAERGLRLKAKKVEAPVVPKAAPKPRVRRPVVKEAPEVVATSAIKRAADARRKLEEMRDSFLDPDYDFIPERW